jgi:PTS system fructose-specific IIA component
MALLKRECILFETEFHSKEEILIRMTETLTKNGYLSDPEDFIRDLRQREEMAPTYIGHEIGLPHGFSEGVKESGICIARLKEPVRWSAQRKDSEVTLVIMLAAARSKDALNTKHLKLLQQLSMLLVHEEFRTRLLKASPEDIYRELLTYIEEE